ncbi:hypothetical protein THAOC_37497 [Thalassiosira oceanica]|uniref:Uncharacterized protein n=1 Tax=Thalassiosira oceanica TaxID=159749 RepID=K0R026_THAOC|nr:hypothetical protein THAOC_37497 [Thalassiosira oceanica]|eukprot:EJK44004.1 hypothetical protein THAOC_37497 [Thalassiosira oceanica]
MEGIRLRSPTRGGRPDSSSDSGDLGRCLRIFRTPSSRGDSRSKDRWSPRARSAGTHHKVDSLVGFEVGKALLSYVRWRPPAARHDGHEKADLILCRRFQSGPVIISGEA